MYSCILINKKTKNWWQKKKLLVVNESDPIEIDGDFFGFGPAEIFIKNQPILFKI